jgi:hypothetical protein
MALMSSGTGALDRKVVAPNRIRTERLHERAVRVASSAVARGGNGSGRTLTIALMLEGSSLRERRRNNQRVSNAFRVAQASWFAASLISEKNNKEVVASMVKQATEKGAASTWSALGKGVFEVCDQSNAIVGCCALLPYGPTDVGHAANHARRVVASSSSGSAPPMVSLLRNRRSGRAPIFAPSLSHSTQMAHKGIGPPSAVHQKSSSSYQPVGPQ